MSAELRGLKGLSAWKWQLVSFSQTSMQVKVAETNQWAAHKSDDLAHRERPLEGLQRRLQRLMQDICHLTAGASSI